MNVLEIVARTFSVESADGNFIFRPWGSRGPCYLLSKQQRSVRAWIQLGFYGLAIAAFWLFPDIASSVYSLATFAVCFTLLGWALFWLFSIGLSKAERPHALTREQRRNAMTAHSLALGRPILWALMVISWLFVLIGGAMVLLLHEWVSGVVIVVFFGAGAALFTWQLQLLRKRSNASQETPSK